MNRDERFSEEQLNAFVDNELDPEEKQRVFSEANHSEELDALRDRPRVYFAEAAHAAGALNRRIIFRHVLPNGMAPVLVAASFGVASAIRSICAR